MKYAFQSLFSERIQNFIAQKNALGFPYTDSSRILRNFDSMCKERFPEECHLTKEICDAWAIKKDTECNNTFSNRLMPIREFARYLIRIGETAYVLPMNLVRHRSAYPPYIYSENEIMQIWDAYDNMKIYSNFPIRHIVIPAMVKLMYCCGLRPSEPRRLQVHDVDLKKGRLNIMESKQHRSRIVMMTDDVMEMLIKCDRVVSSVMPDRIPFFPNSDGDFYGKRGMEKTFRKILQTTKIPINKEHPPRLYDFRHTFATHRIYQWIREGKDIKSLIPYLSAYMGHEQLSDTYYYIHLVPEQFQSMAGFDFYAAERLLPEVSCDE